MVVTCPSWKGAGEIREVFAPSFFACGVYAPLYAVWVFFIVLSSTIVFRALIYAHFLERANFRGARLSEF